MSQSQEESTVDPRLDFSLLNSLLILLDLPLTRKSNTKKLSNFAKLQFLNTKKDIWLLYSSFWRNYFEMDYFGME